MLLMSNSKPNDLNQSSASARIGLVLFVIYVLLYAGLIGIVLFRPELLSTRPFGGVNLAIAYGMGLIGAAFLLAIVYMIACRIVEGSPASRQAASPGVVGKKQHRD